MSKKEYLNLRIEDPRYEYKKELFKYIDSLTIKVQHLCLDVCHFKTDLRNLDEEQWTEFVTSIEGKAIGGSISVNGSSAVRRSGSLSIAVNNISSKYPINRISDVDNIISLNKKVEVAIGIENTGYLYPEHKIFWFSLGMFLIKSANISKNNSGLSISVTLTDMMGMLNGELGGIIFGATTHSPINIEGQIEGEPVEYVALIQSLLTDYCSFNKDKINIKIPKGEKDDNGNMQYITEIGDTSYKLTASWYGTDTIYIDDKSSTISLTPFEGATPYQQYENIGYKRGALTYSGNLSSKGGETIVSVLDKIKNSLGNFEYFFDIDGIFHFQEIDNGLNSAGSAEISLGSAINAGYFIESLGEPEYILSQDNGLVTSYINDPQYSQIKNDFIVWGKSSKDNASALRYHVIITDLSEIEFHTYAIQSSIDKFGVTRVDAATRTIGEGSIVITPNDWRHELYLYYISIATDKNNNDFTWLDSWIGNPNTLFAKELIEEFPKIYYVNYNPKDKDDMGGWKYTISYENMKYYIDAIDVSQIVDSNNLDSISPLVKKLSIDNIGLRTKVINDDKVNCVLEKAPQNFIIPDNLEDSSIADNIKMYTTQKCAYNVIRSALHDYISYNNTISIQTLPMYYLEPNIRIWVDDNDSDIHGQYVITNFSISLGVDGMMSISAKKALQRI